jgi:hypothetical protein
VSQSTDAESAVYTDSQWRQKSLYLTSQLRRLGSELRDAHHNPARVTRLSHEIDTLLDRWHLYPTSD